MSSDDRQIAVKCPNCNQLVNQESEYCVNCNYPLKRFDRVFDGYRKKKPSAASSASAAIAALSLPTILLWLTVAVFGLMVIPGFINPRISANFSFFLPAPVFQGIYAGIASRELIFDQAAYWRLISAVYVHANVLHIAFNMFFLKQITPLALRFFSLRVFFIIYTLAGVGGNLLAVVAEGPVVGASGALFGIVGALIVLGRMSKTLLGQAVYRSLISWSAVMFLIGFLIQNISNAAHLGGLITGALCGYLAHIGGNSFQRVVPLFFGVCVALTAISVMYMAKSMLFLFQF